RLFYRHQGQLHGAVEEHQLGVFWGVYPGEHDFGGHRRHRDYERDAGERDAAAEGNRRKARNGRDARGYPEAIHHGKLYAVHRRRSHRHCAGISGGAGAADVYAIPGFGADVRSSDGGNHELGSGIVFRDLSGAACGAARSRGGVEVGLMALMTLEQARENFLAAMETLRSSKVRSALTVLGIVIGVSSVISMAAIIQGLNKFVQDRVERLGSRTYFISRFPFGTDPSRLPEKIRTRKYLEYHYAEFVRGAAPDVRIVTTFGTRGFFFGDSNRIISGDRSVEKVVIRGAERSEE